MNKRVRLLAGVFAASLAFGVALFAPGAALADLGLWFPSPRAHWGQRVTVHSLGRYAPFSGVRVYLVPMALARSSRTQRPTGPPRNPRILSARIPTSRPSCNRNTVIHRSAGAGRRLHDRLLVQALRATTWRLLHDRATTRAVEADEARPHPPHQPLSQQNRLALTGAPLRDDFPRSMQWRVSVTRYLPGTSCAMFLGAV